MKKEVLIAIIIGFGLGLIITFGIWKANQSLREIGLRQTPTEPPLSNPQEQFPTPTSENALIITTPEDNSISNQENIAITGKTAPDANLAIVYNDGEKIIQADSSGLFSTQITLSGGVNQITVTSVDNDGNEYSQTINVVYSTSTI